MQDNFGLPGGSYGSNWLLWGHTLRLLEGCHMHPIIATYSQLCLSRIGTSQVIVF